MTFGKNNFQGCLPLRALHVTLASLHLSTSEDVEAAAQVIENFGQATGLEQLQASSGITFDGENFSLHVKLKCVILIFLMSHSPVPSWHSLTPHLFDLISFSLFFCLLFCFCF